MAPREVSATFVKTMPKTAPTHTYGQPRRMHMQGKPKSSFPTQYSWAQAAISAAIEAAAAPPPNMAPRRHPGRPMLGPRLGFSTACTQSESGPRGFPESPTSFGRPIESPQCRFPETVAHPAPHCNLRAIESAAAVSRLLALCAGLVGQLAESTGQVAIFLGLLLVAAEAQVEAEGAFDPGAFLRGLVRLAVAAVRDGAEL